MLKFIYRTFILVPFCLFLGAFNLQSQSMHYLALGDSYTIGEAVEAEKNWPNQLVSRLQKEGFPVQTPKIIAVTGWRTDELLQTIEDQKNELREDYHLVSLLIGVNNQYQNKPIRQYKKEFETLLKKGLSNSKYGAKGMFVVSIPNYGVSDFAKKKELKKVGKEIAKYNAVAQKIAAQYEVAFYNITPVSEKTAGDISMYAEDELHPSAKQYQLWVDVFYESIKQQVASLPKEEE